MVTDQLSENREMTKAMSAISERFCGAHWRTTVITYSEFVAIENYIETLEHEKMQLSCENHSLLSQQIQPEDYKVDAREALSQHLDTCPGCGGVADNGYDRSWPEPNPYYCTKCQEDDLK